MHLNIYKINVNCLVNLLLYFYLVFLCEVTGVLTIVFGDGINVWGLVDLELLFDVHLIPVYGPIIIKYKRYYIIDNEYK